MHGGICARDTGIDTCHIYRARARVRGRKFFHRRCINWLYWKRGYDAQIHRNTIIRVRVLIVKLIVKSCGFCVSRNARNRVMVRAFTIMILVYSARKK